VTACPATAIQRISISVRSPSRPSGPLKITWGMNIIQGLRTSLDAQKGGEVAANLDALYEYMGRRLLEANVSNDVAILDEVSSLLMEVKAGWDNIPADYH